MWKEQYDLINQLQEKLAEFVAHHSKDPQEIILSPSAFEWLLSIFAEDKKILGVSPINYDSWTFNTDHLSLKIVIDELADDFAIEIH